MSLFVAAVHPVFLALDPTTADCDRDVLNHPGFLERDWTWNLIFLERPDRAFRPDEGAVTCRGLLGATRHSCFHSTPSSNPPMVPFC